MKQILFNERFKDISDVYIIEGAIFKNKAGIDWDLNNINIVEDIKNIGILAAQYENNIHFFVTTIEEQNLILGIIKDLKDKHCEIPDGGIIITLIPIE
ncbi:hypothetical protein [Clostridium perfringens]|uniref:hypothetical protein n=1 Tax=Clostridium perfringens TaxID=1502 RepID=UPI003F423C1E